jgi:hypothetical protein
MNLDELGDVAEEVGSQSEWSSEGVNGWEGEEAGELRSLDVNKEPTSVELPEWLFTWSGE